MIHQVPLRFDGPHAKAAYLWHEAFRDASLPLVRRTAERFARIRDPYQRALAAHRFVRDAIRYVRDLGGEELADSEVILLRGFDDCDGKTRVLVAIITAAERLAPVGLRARPVPVFPEPDVFSHIAAELSWPGSSDHPRARDGWVRSETILAGCPLGSGTEAAQRDDAGRVLYA